MATRGVLLLTVVFCLATATPDSPAGVTDTVEGGGTRDTGQRSVADYYVTPDGRDFNNGSRAHPWKTIGRADHLPPGSTVHIAPGTYFSPIVTHDGGLPGARVRYLSEVRWGARIVATDNSDNPVWSIKGNYVDVIGFDVSGSTNIGILANGSFIHILGNRVHDLTRCGPAGQGGAGVDSFNNEGSDNWIIGNLVHDLATASNPPGTCRPGMHGIYLNNPRGLVQNNVVYRAQTYGIALYHNASNAVVSNNTVVNCGGGSPSGGDGGGILIGASSTANMPNDHTIVTNNIVRDNPVWGIMENFCSPACGPNNTYTNNLVFHNGIDYRMRSLTPPDHVRATLTADPKFANNTGDHAEDYRLRDNSPAIDAGTSLGAPNIDFDGGNRPRGKAWDIGASEWGAQPAAWPWYSKEFLPMATSGGSL